MALRFDERAYRRSLFYLLLTLALGYLLFHSLAGGTLLAHSAYDSYSLQAENWLAGRNYIAEGENYTYLELAIWQGRYYLSFPPVPGVVMLPLVCLLGGAAAVPSNLVAACIGLITATGVFCLFQKCSFAPVQCVYWAVLVCAGSNFWWLSTSGGVWFVAQCLNLCFVVWGLRLACGTGTGAHTAAALLLALAVGCRPFSILILALYMLHLLRGQCTEGAGAAACAKKGGLVSLQLPGAGFWLPFAAAAAVGACMAAYNYARFGSPIEFGHSYLPEFMRLENGQFALCYFMPNLLQLLRPVTLTAALDLVFPKFNGFLIFAANPVFLLWAVRLVRRACARSFSLRDGVLLCFFAAGLAALCLHETLGGWQFGARYTVDLIPYVLLSETAQKGDAKTAAGACAADASAASKPGEYFLLAAAVLFNLYGAVYMLSQ